MEPKKTKKADLESKKPFFFQIGLVITLAVVLWAFQLRQYERPEYDLGQLELDLIEEEDIPITRPEEPDPPPPDASEELVIVEDDVDVEDEFVIDAEADFDEAIPDYDPVDFAEEEEDADEDYIFQIVEDEPEFPGGMQAMQEYLRDNIRYPTMAREAGIEGTVFVTFVVERDGSITNVEVQRGIGGGCDEEAIRVVQNMPNWEPGEQRGQPVRVQFTLPVRFVLN